jgi:predicted nucleic acid-binding protein
MASPPLPRIFLDSSVLFAAAASATGASRALVILAELGLLRLVVCSQIFEEVERNLRTKAPAALIHFRRLQAALAWEVIDDPAPEEVHACMDVIAAKDAPILAAAIKARPQRLVTLDVHDFDRPEVRQRVTFPIQTPGELLADIRQTLAEGLG